MIRFCKILLFLVFFSHVFAKEASNIEQTDSADLLTIPEEDDYVFVLNSENFGNFIENNQLTVVFFHAPWCGHCTHMKPFYHSAGKLLREDEAFKTDFPVVFAKLDATEHISVASRYHIQGYPTIKIFRKFQDKIFDYEYEGPREDGAAIARHFVKESSKDWKPSVSKVSILGLTNFTEWVQKHEVSLVEFYSPNCGYCIQLAPNYEKAAKVLSEQTDPIPLAKVDATLEPELSIKYNVSGYPTLYVFRKKRHYEYKGGRDSHDIIKYMLKSRNSVSKEVNTFKAFTSYVKKTTEFYVLGLFNAKTDRLYEIYCDFTSRYAEDFSFFHTFKSDEFLKNLRSDQVKVPTVLVYYHDLVVIKNEPKFRVLEKENPTAKDLEDFLFKDALPLVSHITPENKILIYDKIKPICYVFYDIDEELRSHLITLRDKVGNVARKFNQVKFALANQTLNYDLIRSVFLEDSENENDIVCVNEKSKLFIFKEEIDSFDEGEAKSFVSKFLSGKIKPYIKSEAPPKANDRKLVRIAVGKTIDKIIETPGKEIFIAFVGHERFPDLERIEQNLDKIAAEYAPKKNVEFYKINSFKNDFPEVFKPSPSEPSFFYLPSKDKKNPVRCQGEDWTSVVNLKKFVRNSLKQTASDDRDEL